MTPPAAYVNRLVKPTAPVEPQKPDRDSVAVYVVQSGETASAIAEKHHVTTSQISGVSNLSNLFPGNELRVETYKKSTWQKYEAAREKYNADLSKYDQDLNAYMAEEKKKNNINNFNANLGKIQNYYGNDYTILRDVDQNGNPTGYFYLKVKKEKTLYQIKNELGIDRDKNGNETHAGTITTNNPWLKATPMKEIGETGVMTRDNQVYKPGERAIKLPGSCLNVKKPNKSWLW